MAHFARSSFVARASRISAAGLGTMLLACVEDPSLPNSGGSTPLSERSGSVPTAAYDVAPDLFDADGLAVWDGARTLQGIWVAHPLATSAIRVRIINSSNDLSVDGALFRRDATLAGPSVLISSDAAQALALEPGVPTTIRVVALQETVPATLANAGSPIAESLVWPDVKNRQAEEFPRRRPVKKRFSDRAQDLMAQASAETGEAASASPLELGPASTPGANDTPPAAIPDVSSNAGSEDELELPPGATLLPAEPPPNAATDAEETTNRRPVSARFVQAGTFSVADNADKLVARLRDKGLPARAIAETVSGKPVKRVVVGPFDTKSDRDRALRVIRQMGLRDAVPVRG